MAKQRILICGDRASALVRTGAGGAISAPTGRWSILGGGGGINDCRPDVIIVAAAKVGHRQQPSAPFLYDNLAIETHFNVRARRPSRSSK